jgi:hypothetical protein
MNVIAASNRCCFPPEAESTPPEAALEEGLYTGVAGTSANNKQETIPRKQKEG